MTRAPCLASDAPRAGSFEIAVQDATGHRSPTIALTVPACTVAANEDAGALDAGARAPDANVPPLQDGGVLTGSIDAATSDATVRDEGCALGGTRPGASLFGLALALIARRRRRT